MKHTGVTLSQRPPPPWLKLLVIGPFLLGLADGCFRQPTETTTSAPPPTQSTSMEEDDTVLCNEDQQLRFVCWHEGTCYAEDILGSEVLFCHCKPEFTGVHCEEFYVDPNLFPPGPVKQQHLRTAHIAAGVAVCILVIFVILLAIYVWLRQRKLRSRRQKRPLVDHDHNKSSQSFPLNGVETAGQDRGKEKERGNNHQNGNTENGGYRDKTNMEMVVDGEASYPLNQGNSRQQVDV